MHPLLTAILQAEDRIVVVEEPGVARRDEVIPSLPGPPDTAASASTSSDGSWPGCTAVTGSGRSARVCQPTTPRQQAPWRHRSRALEYLPARRPVDC
jgi:hypothetical protein